MGIMKNEIPILEFDPECTSIIMPDHEKLDLHLPRKAVFAFLGEYIEEYAQRHNCEKVAEFVSATKIYPIYIMNYKGENICMCQAPVGAAPAVQLLDWLIGYGVEEIISAGSCGVLVDLPENTFLIPKKALRDEGTSYHYLMPSRYVEVNPFALRAIEKALKEHGLKYTEVISWSTDGFYRETREKVLYRKEEGCAVVEMECSALAACAQMRGVVWGEILFTEDTLADVDKYDERNWGEDSFAYALELCLDAVMNVK